MKKTLSKILIIILIILTLNNFFISNISFAANVGEFTYYDGNNKIFDFLKEALEDVLGKVIGILTIPFKLGALAAGFAINGLTAAVAYSANDGLEWPAVSPFDIIFNKVKLVDINFFDIEDNQSIVMKIRMGVANWYYAMRTIAAAILFCILIYVGIRMAISTIADDKARYKKMLIDWVVSLALIFLIQYIIVFTININNVIVDALHGFIDKNGKTSIGITNTYVVLAGMALGFDIEAIAATALYCILVWQTMGLFISYFNRMLKIAFLIIISPLITLTYSIDKMGDGKAQVLNSWLKEFVFTILLQPFHCIIYMSMINIAFSFLTDATGVGDVLLDQLPIPDNNNNSLAYAIIAILCVRFVKEAEKIVRKIFHFEDDGSTGLDKGLIVATAAMKMSGKAGKSVAKGVNKAKSLKANAPDKIRSLKADAMVVASALGRGDGSLTGTTKEKKEQALTILENKEADKQAKKLKNSETMKKYTVARDGETKESKELKELAKNIQNSNPEMSSARALARARKQVAEKERNKEKNAKKDAKKAKRQQKSDDRQKKLEKKHPKVADKRRKILNAAGTIRELSQTDTVVKEFGSLAKNEFKAGIAAAPGFGMYGAGEGVMQSIMASATTYNAVNEYMKMTGKTIAEDVSSSFNVIGCKDVNDMANKTDQIMSDPKKYEKNSTETKRLLEQLKNSLKKLGLDDNKAKGLSNRINNKLQANIANGNLQDVDKILTAELRKNGIDPNIMDIKDVKAATNEMNIFENERNIFNGFNNATSAGISYNLFIDQTSDIMDRKDLWTEESTTENPSKVDEYLDDAEHGRRSTIENYGIEKNSETELDDYNKELEKVIEKAEERVEKLEEDNLDLQSYGYDNDAEIGNLNETIDKMVEEYIEKYFKLAKEQVADFDKINIDSNDFDAVAFREKLSQEQKNIFKRELDRLSKMESLDSNQQTRVTNIKNIFKD